jgi:hypothetical protein
VCMQAHVSGIFIQSATLHASETFTGDQLR